MDRICFLLKVRPERLLEYKERHTRVWPEMLRAIRNAGWYNYSLFLSEDGLVVGYFETDDFRAAMEALAQEEINTLWQKEMAPFLVELRTDQPEQRMLRLEQIFHAE